MRCLIPSATIREVARIHHTEAFSNCGDLGFDRRIVGVLLNCAAKIGAKVLKKASSGVRIRLEKIVESLDGVCVSHDLVRTTEGFYDTALNEAGDV